MILPVLSLLLRSLILKLADDKMQRITVGDVKSVRSAYSALFEDRIYIRFAKTYLCDQV
jgi:hypothetical protein